MALSQVPSHWDDDDFLACSDGARVTYHYLLTGRYAEATAPGLLSIPGGVCALAEPLRKTPLEIAAHVAELTRRGLIQVDRCLVRIMKAPWYKVPQNPKTVVGWYRRWRALPESPLKYEHLMTMRLALVEYRVNERTLAAWDEEFGPELRRAQPAQVAAAITAIEADDLLVIPGSVERSRDLFEQIENKSSIDQEQMSSSSSQIPGSDDTVSTVGGYRSTRTTTTTIRDQGSGIREGEREREGARSRFASGTQVGADPPAPSPVVQQLFDEQEHRRKQLGLGAADRDYRRIEAALSRYSPEQLLHALAVFHADAIRDRTKARYFNGVTNWSFTALAHTVGRPVDPGARPALDATERYAGGEVL